MKSTFWILFVPLISSVPLKPGEPGGPWTEEEIGIVRDKVIKMMECQAGYSHKGDSCWYGSQVDKTSWPDKFDGDIAENNIGRDDEEVGPRRSWALPSWPWNGAIKPNPVSHLLGKIGPKPGLLIQLAFHDCLKYKDGSGGCDGCLNWHGMGYRSAAMLERIFRRRNGSLVGQWPKFKETTNNKLQLSARSLELIYTLTDWPPGARKLSTSLKESGKSRADLWQFAGNIALEKTINNTNENCHNPKRPEWQISGIEGRDNCEMRLDRPIPFRSGRIDCIPDKDLQWSPYPFEATKKEKHSSAYDSGAKIIQNLKEDFDFTARETISLMALHGLSGGRNAEQLTKYKWIGGSGATPGGSFSNIYYKFLNGKTFWRGNNDNFGYSEYFVGDKEGNPVGGTSFKVVCKGAWEGEDGEEKRKYGGPCQFRPSHPGCALPTNSDLQMRQRCFVKKPGSSGTTLSEFDKKNLEGCEMAELISKDGFLYQKGGPPMSQDEACKTSIIPFAMPYELGFVLNFTMENYYPRGCGPLDGAWRLTGQGPDCNSKQCQGIPKSNRMYIGSPGYNGSPPCGPNKFKLEGEDETSAEIVTKFADSHNEWQKSFFDAWEKMQLNGYIKEDLTESPENGYLLAPLIVR